MGRHLGSVEPAGKNGQLPFVACHILAADKLLVLWRDLTVVRIRLREVLNEDMFAEGSVAVFQAALVLNLEVELVDFLSKGLFVHVDEDGASLGNVKLLVAEGVHYDFARECLHFLFNLIND